MASHESQWTSVAPGCSELQELRVHVLRPTAVQQHSKTSQLQDAALPRKKLGHEHAGSETQLQPRAPFQGVLAVGTTEH